MAKRKTAIGYVVINQAEGGAVVGEQVYEFQAEAERVAKALGSRFAVRALYRD